MKNQFRGLTPDYIQGSLSVIGGYQLYPFILKLFKHLLKKKSDKRFVIYNQFLRLYHSPFTLFINSMKSEYNFPS